jgi:quercetin dioxygenase-like cupin family protein
MRFTARTSVLTLAVLLLNAGATTAGDVPKEAVKLTPSELKWKPSPRVPGLEVADMIGDQTKPGAYLYRVKFPANFKIEAHGHPDERHYTIVSGTWYIGWGKKFDATKLITLPAGSFYTEPANIPHFVLTKDDGAVVQIGGKGPTAVNYVDPAHAPKKK